MNKSRDDNDAYIRQRRNDQRSASTMNAHPPPIASASILLHHRKPRCQADPAHRSATCIVNASALHLLPRAYAERGVSHSAACALPQLTREHSRGLSLARPQRLETNRAAESRLGNDG